MIDDRLRSILSSAVLEGIGFQAVSESSLIYRLNDIEQIGGSALRDSIVTGVYFISHLNSALSTLGTAKDYTFVHIIVTDGQDTCSRNTLEQTQAYMLQIGTEVNVDRCRTIVIGIDLEEDLASMRELQSIVDCGLENCELHDIKTVNIEDLFRRIQVSLDLYRTKEVAVVANAEGEMAVLQQDAFTQALNVTKRQYAVLFNLDTSTSMNGERWKRVNVCIREFLKSLDWADLVGGIAFNDKVRPITQERKTGKADFSSQKECHCRMM